MSHDGRLESTTSLCPDCLERVLGHYLRRDGEVPDVPAAMSEALCLAGHRDRSAVLENIEAAGFDVEAERGHREDLLAMRDELAGRVDYEGLLGLLGERGRRALAGIETLEDAVESGRIDYVSVVAEAV